MNTTAIQGSEISKVEWRWNYFVPQLQEGGQILAKKSFYLGEVIVLTDAAYRFFKLMVGLH